MKSPKPVIKWSGSKRSQAIEIIKHFPKEISVYYEPFCGGCSVARALMESTEHKVGMYCLSDSNPHLIKALELIKYDYKSVLAFYTMMWEALKKIDDIKEKKSFYNKLRDRFNEEESPFDFIVLDRLCYNGLIRYNSKGEFNSPYHLNRDGINPSSFGEILKDWNEALINNHVYLNCCDYRNVPEIFQIGFSSSYSFAYFDPPYANTSGMYQSGFSQDDFFNFLRGFESGYVFSYDGTSGNDDMTVDIPRDLYNEHYYIKSGNSSFKRLKSEKDAVVYESLYIKN